MSIVTMVLECCFFIVQVWRALVLEMMMSVLQEIEGLTKDLFFIILPVGKSVSMQKFQTQCLHGLPVYT